MHVRPVLLELADHLLRRLLLVLRKPSDLNSRDTGRTFSGSFEGDFLLGENSVLSEFIVNWFGTRKISILVCSMPNPRSEFESCWRCVLRRTPIVGVLQYMCCNGLDVLGPKKKFFLFFFLFFFFFCGGGLFYAFGCQDDDPDEAPVNVAVRPTADGA